ncbi:MAG: Rap1a/Tai family immunity protein [Rhodopila sp.]
MKKNTISVATLAIASMIASGARAAPVTREDFQVETAANLISLCSAAETDPLYTAARNFCHGFAVGTFRVLATEEAAMKTKRKMFCMPATQPTRDQAIAGFVQWASDRPKPLAGSPTDAIAAYLAAAYPCK